MLSVGPADLAADDVRALLAIHLAGMQENTPPEHVFALILALRRNLLAYRADIEAGQWQASPRFCLYHHPIRDLAGSRLGLIGYGNLGRGVAKLARAFEMEVVTHTRTPSAEHPNLPLNELLQTSDIVSLHLPLSAATRHMIGAQELASMKRDALLINSARGGLVDEAALAHALQHGLIGGAGFDVLSKEPPAPDHPLLLLRQANFLLTPHNAWASRDAMQRLADILIDNIEHFVGRELA